MNTDKAMIDWMDACMNKQLNGMNERISGCMSLHTGRQSIGQGVEEGVNGGW